ncbi:MAG TPA: hypothetical protein VH350_04340 [Candidatus Sulfotelmatobacter sp.]|nr:hypothetical protein [Candidatus Sulfotelmatobacter sp.]
MILLGLAARFSRPFETTINLLVNVVEDALRMLPLVGGVGRELKPIAELANQILSAFSAAGLLPEAEARDEPESAGNQ